MMPSDAATRAPPRYTYSFRLLPNPFHRSATSTPPGLLLNAPFGRSTVRSNRSHHTAAHSGTSPLGAPSRSAVPDQSTGCAVFLSVAAPAGADVASDGASG